MFKSKKKILKKDEHTHIPICFELYTLNEHINNVYILNDFETVSIHFLIMLLRF